MIKQQSCMNCRCNFNGSATSGTGFVVYSKKLRVIVNMLGLCSTSIKQSAEHGCL